MADYLMKVSRNALLDRLRVLQSDLTGENRHSDAMTVDFAIQALNLGDSGEEYVPNENTFRIPLEDWRKLNHG